MSQKQELLDLLANLPEVDTVDKRKALLGFIGFSYLGIYLDWEGAPIEFSARLVEELGRRGQLTMVQFLDNLPSAPQVGMDRKTKVASLATAIKALAPPAWEGEFGLPPAAPPAGQAPDPDMLALTVVSTVLVPYFKGPVITKSQVAGQVAARLEQALAADPTALALWAPFKLSPEGLEQAMVAIVKARLAQDSGLAQELVLLTASAMKELIERKPGEVDVTQRIRLVQGKVLGAAIGSDVVNGIIKVCQEVDTVDTGGTLIGFQGGSIGGKVVRRDIDTGGGAYMKGGVQTGGGDFIGRDKHVEGDEVRGDKIGGGKVNLGGDANEVRFENVTIIQSGTPPEHEDAKPLIEETIRLDVAAPSEALLDEPFDVAVAVRQPDAPALTLEALTEVTSGEGSIFRKEEDEVVKYRIELAGAGFNVVPPHYIVKLRPHANSRPCFFQVTATRPGKRVLLISAYQEDDALAAQTRVRIEIVVPVEPRTTIT